MFIDKAVELIFAEIEHVQLREMRVKSFGDSIIQEMEFKLATSVLTVKGQFFCPINF
jgi:hypothetical protein